MKEYDDNTGPPRSLVMNCQDTEWKFQFNWNLFYPDCFFRCRAPASCWRVCCRRCPCSPQRAGPGGSCRTVRSSWLTRTWEANCQVLTLTEVNSSNTYFKAWHGHIRVQMDTLLFNLDTQLDIVVSKQIRYCPTWTECPSQLVCYKFYISPF